MENNLLARLAEANLAAAVAILAVLALRGPARAVLGARAAYGLWLIAPAAMLASLIPARTILVPAPVALAPQVLSQTVMPAASSAAPAATVAMPDLYQVLVGLWLVGVAVSLILLAMGQRRALARFGRITADALDPRLARASNPEVGPALLGVLRPRVIVPADFEARFDAGERAMVLAHERTHLAAGHAAINAAVALIRCVNWFNPLVHLGARYARIDQELACDAAVVGRFPDQRRTYAEALLKTQLAVVPLPLGCDWPVRSPGLLEERIKMLARQTPGRIRLFAGAAAIAALTLGAGVAAWSAEPPVKKTVAAPLNDAPPRAPIPTSRIEAVLKSAAGDIRRALERGASAPEIDRMIRPLGVLRKAEASVDPDKVVFVRAPAPDGTDGGLALGFPAKPYAYFFGLSWTGYVPPNLAAIPTMTARFGPMPPDGRPAMLAVGRMVLTGATPQDVAAVLLAARLLPATVPGDTEWDPSTARFVRLADLPGANPVVGLGVSRKGTRTEAWVRIPGTRSYSGLASLPAAAEAAPHAAPTAPRPAAQAPAAQSGVIRKVANPAQPGVNAFLWRATLDTLAFAPLASAEPYDRVLTDWYTNPEKTDERLKITVDFLDTGDGLNVTAFKQVKDAAGNWIDAPVAKQTNIDVKNAILTRAGQRRLSNLNP